MSGSSSSSRMSRRFVQRFRSHAGAEGPEIDGGARDGGEADDVGRKRPEATEQSAAAAANASR